MASAMVEQRKALHELFREIGIGRGDKAWDIAWRLLLEGFRGTTRELVVSALVIDGSHKEALARLGQLQS